MVYLLLFFVVLISVARFTLTIVNGALSYIGSCFQAVRTMLWDILVTIGLNRGTIDCYKTINPKEC